ncbi:hypothetical protein L1987_02755 [Smallanthus sonchifolius]|uniref:Uncharacterized protein n=1 Tax=Smallanthus sonchifolius TaxID=185202 RepID=A0ACB9K8M8_9ASTR|nr:hypothetical protein L1987_02755 [Smallanthus sonchifolius]
MCGAGVVLCSCTIILINKCGYYVIYMYFMVIFKHKFESWMCNPCIILNALIPEDKSCANHPSQVVVEFWVSQSRVTTVLQEARWCQPWLSGSLFVTEKDVI